MTRTIRAGLIGAGQICEFHVRALRRVPNVEIVGVTDVDPARARAVADRFGIRATYSTLKGLVEAGVDVVHVLTPPTSHAAITLEALGLGCHVLVEKPLATSKEDSQRIVEAARQAERTVGVDHSLLFDPFVKRAMTLLRRGEIGDVVAVDYFRCQRAPDYRGGVLPPQYDEPGYPFRDMGVHALYLLEASPDSSPHPTATSPTANGGRLSAPNAAAVRFTSRGTSSPPRAFCSSRGPGASFGSICMA